MGVLKLETVIVAFLAAILCVVIVIAIYLYNVNRHMLKLITLLKRWYDPP